MRYLKKIIAKVSSDMAVTSLELSRENVNWILASTGVTFRRPVPSPVLGETVDYWELESALSELLCTASPITAADFTDEAKRVDISFVIVVPSLSEKGKASIAVAQEGDVYRITRADGTRSVLQGKSDFLDYVKGQSLIQVRPLGDEERENREGLGWAWFLREFFARPKVVRDVVVASLFITIIGLGAPLATQAIVDKVITNQSTSTLIALGTGIGIMAILGGVLQWLRQKYLLRIAAVVDESASRKLFRQLLQLPVGYFTHQASGTLVNKLHGVERMREFIAGAFLLGALELPFAAVFLWLMSTYSIGLTVVVACFLLVQISISLMVAPLLQKRAALSMRKAAALQGFVTERLAAIETVKCLQMESTFQREYGSLNGAQLKATLELKELGSLYGVLIRTLDQLLGATILCVGAYWAMTEGTITIGMLVAFQMFTQRVSQPLLTLSGMWQEYQQVKVSAAMLGDITSQGTERYSPFRHKVNAGPGSLEVSNLSFSYANDGSFQLQGLSFQAPTGGTMLINGASGRGKSTLGKVLLGINEGYQGSVKLCGRELRAMSVNDVRGVFGVVPQESVLFSGSILENLLLSSPEATHEQAVVACKMAGVHRDIEALTGGYEYRVGERGAGLSLGQRQRIAVARALLRRPKILIFDEAVASLDDKAAELIASTVNELRGKVTILFITHKTTNNLIIDSAISL